jgi:hypothetical protein
MGTRSIKTAVTQLATYTWASKNRSISLSGFPLKSPQWYSLVKLTGVIWARVDRSLSALARGT